MINVDKVRIDQLKDKYEERMDSLEFKYTGILTMDSDDLEELFSIVDKLIAQITMKQEKEMDAAKTDARLGRQVRAMRERLIQQYSWPEGSAYPSSLLVPGAAFFLRDLLAAIDGKE